MNERVCIITGASRGIGKAAALRFARAGARVVLNARDAGALHAAEQELRGQGGACAAYAGDVSRPGDCQSLVHFATQKFGRVDVLVNNAGVAPLAPIEKLALDDYRRAIAVNIDAVFYMTRAVWPLYQQQRGGVIVNISSVASLDPFPGFAVYGATKAWVNLFTKACAEEGKPSGIRVYAVAPGAVETHMLRERFPDFPREHALPPEDVAATIEAVCDERLAYSSGQTIFVRR